MRGSLIVLALTFSFTIGAVGCSDAPSESDCRKLMEHLIEIEMTASGGRALPPELEKDGEAVKKRVLGHVEEDFMKSCTKSLPKSQVECGLKAKTPDDLAACDEG